MSNTSSPPLRLELHASAWLGAAIAVLTLLAALCIVRSSLPAISLVLLPPLAWRAAARLRRGACATLVFRADGTAARLRDGGREDAFVPRSFVERGPLAVLEIDDAAGTHRFVTAPDTLDAAQRRLLRLWFGRHAHVAAPLHGTSHA